MDYLKLIIPVLVALIAWLGNEWRKRQWEEYQRKEARYQELIMALKGFYLSSWNQDESKIMKNHFIDQLNLCWLYCPDEVILKAYAFIDMILADRTRSDEEKELTLGELILAIRKDLIGKKVLSRTQLKPGDFRILTST